MNLRVLLVFSALLPTGCGGKHVIRVTSDLPAKIVESQIGCLLCKQIPCRVEVSRETCFGYDSSSGYAALKALLPDLRSITTMLGTCDISDGARVDFVFGGAAKGGDQEKAWQTVTGPIEVDSVDQYMQSNGQKHLPCSFKGQGIGGLPDSE